MNSMIRIPHRRRKKGKGGIRIKSWHALLFPEKGLAGVTPMAEEIHKRIIHAAKNAESLGLFGWKVGTFRILKIPPRDVVLDLYLVLDRIYKLFILLCSFRADVISAVLVLD